MSAGQWGVEVREPNDRLSPNAGYFVEQPSEAGARKLFDDRVNAAPALGYEAVKLRHGDAVIKRLPT